MLLLGRKTSLERVAAFLPEMDGRITAIGVMALPMSRRDIADYLGLALETVSRELSRLQRTGVLGFLDIVSAQSYSVIGYGSQALVCHHSQSTTDAGLAHHIITTAGGSQKPPLAASTRYALSR
jgi:hypothetical protein